MNNKKVLLSASSVILFLTFFSGIIRHDVDEKDYLELASEKQFDCVGQVYKDTSASGSCVLIGDRFVLSAAHVFIDSDSRSDTIDLYGHKAVVYVTYNDRVTDVSKLTLIFNGQRVKVKNVLLHPHYLDSLSKGSCDIAILELEEPLMNITPIKINTAFDELNSRVVGVGYGASGPANRPDLICLYNKKIAGENIVDSIGGQSYVGHQTILLCDFDHPTREDCNKLGSATPTSLEYICSGGDSGGGLFRRKLNNWELIGICSEGGVDINQLLKSGYYGQTMQWTRISVLANWISQQTL